MSESIGWRVFSLSPWFPNRWLATNRWRRNLLEHFQNQFADDVIAEGREPARALRFYNAPKPDLAPYR